MDTPDPEGPVRIIQEAARHTAVTGGFGTRTEDFAELWISARQAEALAALPARHGEGPCLYTLDEQILDMVIDRLVGETPASFYFTDAVNELMAYDNQNGTDLLPTLYTYLSCNLNASRAIEVLHIARSTFLYRLSRIREIAGIDPEDYRTRVYLELLQLIQSRRHKETLGTRRLGRLCASSALMI